MGRVAHLYNMCSYILLLCPYPASRGERTRKKEMLRQPGIRGRWEGGGKIQCRGGGTRRNSTREPGRPRLNPFDFR